MELDLHSRLNQSFGFKQFRPGQEQTITQLLNGRSSLAIFPTGSGKSLCYQFTAIQLPHLTLVVSPLLALMKDQLDFLNRHNIPAASIDSTLTPEQNHQVMEQVRSGEIKILMVSVERFKNERFRHFISSIAISMLVVDEAHCISEWGHNFRPDYLKLPLYCQQFNIPLVLLLTATATRKVKQDMAEKFAINKQDIVQTGFYRPNLDLSVLPVASQDKNSQLLQNILEQQGAGIVYVTLQQTAEQVASFLQVQGVNARAYHAGQGDEVRQKIQSDFMADNIQVVVATIAFGMGIDKASIRFVIHYDLPKSIENYSQEIGRAGRDGSKANCITLANLDGINTVENFVYGDTPELTAIESVLDIIKSEQVNGLWEVQILALSNACNIRQLPLKTLLVQLELLGVVQPKHAYFAEFRIKLIKAKEEILAAFNQRRQDFLNTIFNHTQFKKVWGTIDFDALLESLPGERTRIITALEYLQQQGWLELESKRMTEVFAIDRARLADTELAQRLYQYFADKEQKEIARIASLVKFFELDSCLSNNLSLYFDDQAFPGKCGHCSVCRGQVAKLSYSLSPDWPSEQEMLAAFERFRQHMLEKAGQPVSIESGCRFLAGLTEPRFTRAKARQLEGYGLCENFRYQNIREKLQALVSG